jgi:biotin-(acetyl-CoA carboxylase) ligase
MPEDLKDITTSIIIENNRNYNIDLIINDLIYFLDKWYCKMLNKELENIQNAWREFSCVLDKMVCLKVKGDLLEGKVVDLDLCKGIALLNNKGERQWLAGETVEMFRLV